MFHLIHDERAWSSFVPDSCSPRLLGSEAAEFLLRGGQFLEDVVLRDDHGKASKKNYLQCLLLGQLVRVIRQLFTVEEGGETAKIVDCLRLNPHRLGAAVADVFSGGDIDLVGG